jgi:hypothetical protein
VQDDNEWWTIPGSTICGQVCIRLTAEAIAQIREVDGDGYNYELALENVELTNRTPTNHECSIQTSAAMDLRPETLERSVDAFFAPSECPVTLQP